METIKGTEDKSVQLIPDYSEEVEWDDYLGDLSINRNKDIPYNKQIWLPKK